jgi:hypothetical protein
MKLFSVALLCLRALILAFVDMLGDGIESGSAEQKVVGSGILH